jgi:hypothetical protein
LVHRGRFSTRWCSRASASSTRTCDGLALEFGGIGVAAIGIACACPDRVIVPAHAYMYAAKRAMRPSCAGLVGSQKRSRMITSFQLVKMPASIVRSPMPARLTRPGLLTHGGRHGGMQRTWSNAPLVGRRRIRARSAKTRSAGLIFTRSRARLPDCASTISGTPALPSWQRDTSAARCSNTIHTSAWPQRGSRSKLSRSLFLARMGHKIGHSRRPQRKPLRPTD